MREGPETHSGFRAEPAVVETHISVLHFLDDVVLKFKKPLLLPFADLRSRAARLHACESEIHLNRRLSPDVYLGVADLRMGGEVFDHAVVLRRLPSDRSLAVLVEDRDLSLDERLRTLAVTLAAFHAEAARSRQIDSAATRLALGGLWKQCFTVLRSFEGQLLAPHLVRRAETLVERYLRGREALFARRIADHAICEGHGDLLASDVFFLEDGPRVLDCLEFDPVLRHVDVVADIAFLVMDLERLGAPLAARRFADHYREVSHDEFPESLLDHYCAQRAVVRTEVSCLRASQGVAEEEETARNLLDLALTHLRKARTVLGVICGIPGTGKSTIADRAAQRLRWPVLRSDRLRREIVGRLGSGPLTACFESGPYAPGITERTYDLLMQRAREMLGQGRSVLLDATFHESRSQRLAEALAEETASDLVVVRCSSSPDLVAGRIESRIADGSDLSGADLSVAERIAGRWHPWVIASELDSGIADVESCALKVERIMMAE